MSNQLFNEAERFLIGQWPDARLLEESMAGVRAKYKELFQRVVEAIKGAHPEFDACVAFPIQFWGEGSVGVGRKSWLGGQSSNPSGFWLETIRLELLTSEESAAPVSYLWISNESASAINLERARTEVRQAVGQLLTVEEQKGVRIEESGNVLLWLPAPSKRELLDGLLNTDGRAFIDSIVNCFERMARFTPVMDKIFRDCRIE